MQKKIAAALLLLCIAFAGFSRSNIFPTGAKAKGMGDAFVSQFDVFSVYNNQAGLANLKRSSVAFFYENPFLVQELSLRAGVFAFTTGTGNFAVHINSFGPALWSESNAGIAFAKHLSDKLSAGIELSYFGTKLPETAGLLSSFSFEFGAIYQLNDKTFLGAHFANLYSTPIKTLAYEEQIPWQINLGGHTIFTDQFILSYQVGLEKETVPQLKVGAQWEAVENFFIRGGLNTSPSRVFLGLGYHTSFLEIETAFSYHRIMGYTPSVSLIFSFM
jgi:hypothetical protein